MKYDLSVVVPSIHPETWRQFHDTLVESVGKYSFEIIFVGPYGLPENMDGVPNVKAIQDWGCPMRCIQIGALQSVGKLTIMGGGDDGLYVKDSFSEAITLYHEKCRSQDCVVMKHCEGPGRPTHTDTHASDAYWTVGAHEHLRKLGGLNPEYKWGNLLMDNEYFKDIGGLDCVFEVMNHGMHDLAYRLQNNGSKMYFADKFMQNLDWNPNAPGYSYMQCASNRTWHFMEDYFGTNTGRYKIPIDNWKQSPEKWYRFTDPPPPMEVPPYLAQPKRRRKKGSGIKTGPGYTEPATPKGIKTGPGYTE